MATVGVGERVSLTEVDSEPAPFGPDTGVLLPADLIIEPSRADAVTGSLDWAQTHMAGRYCWKRGANLPNQLTEYALFDFSEVFPDRSGRDADNLTDVFQ